MDQSVATKLVESDKIRALMVQFPDLKVRKDRWGTERYSAASANSLVTNYETRHSCGCCGDAPLLVWPYLSTEHGRVFSDPSSFYFARRDHWESEYTLEPSFAESVRKAGLPESMTTPLVSRYPEKRETVEDDGD